MAIFRPCFTETIIFFGTTDENISTFQVKVEKFAQVVHSMQALLVSTYIIFLSNLKKINFAIKKNSHSFVVSGGRNGFGTRSSDQDH